MTDLTGRSLPGTPRGAVPERGREYVAREVFKPSDPWVEEGNGGNSVEFGIADILNEDANQRWKVFKTLKDVGGMADVPQARRKDRQAVRRPDGRYTVCAALSIRHATTDY
jgi:hypothetical protein